MSDASSSRAPIRVAVLVTLFRTPQAGGHVKVWERFAEAAATTPDIDLTVFFLGETEGVEACGPNARFHRLVPRWGTNRFAFLDSGAGHTDLASFHPRLAALLPAFDLMVSTDHFAFGRTAERVQAAGGPPLVHSQHTDVETLTRAYAPAIVGRMLGERLGGWVVRTLDLGERLAEAEAKRLRRHLAVCRHVFLSRADDEAKVQAWFPALPYSFLGRGVDLERFSPRHRDRAWLESRFRVPPGQPVLLFAGRADASKRLLIAAQAVARLLAQGHDLTLIVAGAGRDLPEAQRLCGPRLIAPGVLDQRDLARLFASADLFVFPSESETVGNVVLEARAAGLAAVLSGRHNGLGHLVVSPGEDGFVVTGDGPLPWANAIAEALTHDLRAVGAKARTHMEATSRPWPQVFEEDLARPWRTLARTRPDA
ncbi:glycosyltransferase [Pararhodospirillum oryzae]|uniref:Glycosyl transferase family 1 n=1 Tax=Pararhodospirillum oryzae TaxID=478448 RepID=A0A512H8A9_9PROT|nr:glycosyltransferase [Pararhodospirillum oryzae]GEO81686.1 glycosyl transferase family 1 [Pararhodospirillum oryzae]